MTLPCVGWLAIAQVHRLSWCTRVVGQWNWAVVMVLIWCCAVWLGGVAVVSLAGAAQCPECASV